MLDIVYYDMIFIVTSRYSVNANSVASVPRPRTAVNYSGKSRLRGAPSAYSRVQIFAEFLAPKFIL